MPRSVLAYACQFKCGRKVSVSRKRMVEHEERCFCNPARRACQSCAHRLIYWDTEYNPYHGGDPGSTDTEYKVPYCEARDDVDLEEKLTFDCPQWKPKNPEPGQP